MNIQEIQALKGIHPGIFLERELQKRKLAKGPFAISIGEYPQTLGAITKGKRDMNTPLALKIEHELGMEEGFFMILQTYFDIKEIKRKESLKLHPGLKKFRKAIFFGHPV
ncbi:helix-turn-helix transcriptional regulator [Chitinophaga defluvii]|uniref:Plasmid maintenance system antidote protein VapI n=1 Tax=Chitinophaga defluvii TaxID=3163343 RepID=A0ABV2T8X3_9BACT